jgi:pimeloyl-ACP methyl ester carboxylesterase
MSRKLRQRLAVGAGLLFGVAGGSLWRWKRSRIAELESGSELVTTGRGVVELARRGSGYPVLVLHGDPGGYDQALYLSEALFDDGFEIIAPSRPGYLRTPMVGDGSPAEQASMLLALLDELHVEEALVVGLSGGGPVALQLAAEYPDRVSGLILESAVTTELDERLFDTGRPLVDRLLTSTPVLDVRSGLFEALRRVAPDRLVALLHGMVSTLEGEDLEEYLTHVESSPTHRERSLAFVQTLLPASERIEGTLVNEAWHRRLPLIDYGQLSCPVLVVHGEHDGAVPISHAEYATEAIPDAELLRLRADHLAWIGPDADRASQRVQSFAQSVASSAASPAR